ncbi:MAG TPA: hypothetical protein VIY52_12755 [Streptosporangiaceae bacterium]
MKPGTTMAVSIKATQAARPTEDWSFRTEGVTKIYGGTAARERRDHGVFRDPAYVIS